MKKVLILALLLLIISCTPPDADPGPHFSMVISAGDEIILSYRNGKDVTEENKLQQARIESSISQFLNRSRSDLEFKAFCMLEDDGMTVEVTLDDVSYTFICSMVGDIINVGRTDNKRFGIRGGINT